MAMLDSKTQSDVQLDLKLYIEGLLTVEDEQLDADTTAVATLELTEVEQPHDKLNSHPENNTIPIWGRRPFDCLTLNIAGTRLLLPAAKVDHVECITDKLTRLPVESEAMLGMISIRGCSVMIVDLFSLLSAAGKDGECAFDENTQAKVRYAVVMRDGGYAIACDSIGEIVAMQPESIRWSNTAFNNKFFCGIASDELCPLLDIVELNCAIRALPYCNE